MQAAQGLVRSEVWVISLTTSYPFHERQRFSIILAQALSRNHRRISLQSLRLLRRLCFRQEAILNFAVVSFETSRDMRARELAGKYFDKECR